MKQKKSPVLLLVGVIAMIGIMALINATGMMSGQSSLNMNVPKQEDAPKAKPKLVNSRDYEANKSSLKDALAKKSGNTTQDGEVVAAKNPVRPTILLPEFKRVEATENETATSTMWYRDGSREKDKASKLDQRIDKTR